ncbi:MAG TPA: hypothetical protein VE218_11245 [Acidobacteriaceae bacterium]|nr:hypothetical protein [Acidobacteriaceae bacterium]
MANEKKTSAGLIAAAWIVVSIPLTWGIYNTALGAARLFTHLQAKPPAQMMRTP